MDCPGSAVMSELVELNVGGRVLATTRATLCAIPDTLLSDHFGPSPSSSPPLPRDRNGLPFLDLDIELLELLLAHLRTLTLNRTLATTASDSGSSSPGRAQQVASLPKPPADKKAAWDAMVRYLGIDGSRRTQGGGGGGVGGGGVTEADRLVLLGTFDSELTHEKYSISPDGKRIQKRASPFQTVAMAVVRTCVARGEKRTWRLRVRNTSGTDYLLFGFINEHECARRGWGGEGDHSVVYNLGVYVDTVGTIVQRWKKKRGHNAREPNQKLTLTPPTIQDGTEFTLALDATHPHTPATMQLPELCDEYIELPAHWSGFRLAFTCAHEHDGFEIVSVD